MMTLILSWTKPWLSLLSDLRLTAACVSLRNYYCWRKFGAVMMVPSLSRSVLEFGDYRSYANGEKAVRFAYSSLGVTSVRLGCCGHDWFSRCLQKHMERLGE